MPTTVREKILANIQSTLQTITTLNGYDNTIVSVQRWDKRGNALKDVPCVIVSSGPEQKDESPHPMFTCHLTVYLDVWIRQDAADTTVTDSILSSLLGDIGKALMVDYTRGGFAKNTVMRNNVPFESVEGQPHAGIIIEIEIVYQHQRNNPSIAT